MPCRQQVVILQENAWHFALLKFSIMFPSWLDQGLEEVKAYGTRAEEAVKFKRTLHKTLQRLEDVLPEMVDEEVGATREGYIGGTSFEEGVEIHC